MKITLFCLTLLITGAAHVALAQTASIADDPYKPEGQSAYERERCKLDWHLPEDRPGFPTLVWFHGGGLRHGDKADAIATGLAKHFTSDGIAVVSVNYRLSPKAIYPAYIEDAAAAVAHVRQHVASHGGSENLVFVSGHSAGGYLTAMLGTDARYLKAYGLMDNAIAGYLPVSGQMITHSTVRGERGFEAGRPVIDEAAPAFHVRSGAPPFLCLVGSNDLPVRAAENRYFVAAMKSVEHPSCRYVEFPGRDHSTIANRTAESDDAVAAAMKSFIREISARRAFPSLEAPDHVLDIWPHEPPGEKRNLGPEQDMTKDTDKLIAGQRIIKLGNVTTPQAHVFLAPEDTRTGASVVVCPGGGFNILAWDLEGIEVAQWLNKLGITAIVLKYRVPTREQNPRWMAATQDTQRTLSLVRHHAKEWNLDPDKVAVLGFSAGGTAAIKTSLAKRRYYDSVDKADENSCIPDRAILIYSPGLPGDTNETNDESRDEVTTKTPPVFMVHAFDDFVPVQGAANMILALKRAGIPSECHIYDAGGHGYGLRKVDDLPVTTWIEPCEAWLRRAQWVD